MKFATLIFTATVLCSGHAFAAQKQITLSVQTMVCGPDPHNVKNTLSSLVGIRDVEISLSERQVRVTFDDAKSNVDAMLSAMAGAGYAALLIGGPR
jgi:periplasmic mercuric ion binding protein